MWLVKIFYRYKFQILMNGMWKQLPVTTNQPGKINNRELQAAYNRQIKPNETLLYR